MMESAVNQMQRANIKFYFCPNTFNWKQNIQERFKLTDEEKHKYYIEGFTHMILCQKSHYNYITVLLMLWLGTMNIWKTL